MKMVVLVKKKMNNFDNLQHTNIGKILDKALITTLIAKLYTQNVERTLKPNSISHLCTSMNFKKILVPKINVVYNWITNLQTSKFWKILNTKISSVDDLCKWGFQKKFYTQDF